VHGPILCRLARSYSTHPPQIIPPQQERVYIREIKRERERDKERKKKRKKKIQTDREREKEREKEIKRERE